MLAEMILASFVLLVGALAILRTFPASYRYAAESEHHLEAVRAGRSVLARMQTLQSLEPSSLATLRNLQTTLYGANEDALTSVTYTVTDISFRFGGVNPASDRVANVASVTVQWHEGRLAGANSEGDKQVTVVGGVERAP